jgi:hypothetical protein
VLVRKATDMGVYKTLGFLGDEQMLLNLRADVMLSEY